MVEDEATREFLVETYEGLDQLDREFVALEADPSARERIATIFRIVHTIKGTSGFLGFSRLEALAHAGEGLLVLLRDGSLPMTAPIATTLLAMVDKVRACLQCIEKTGGESSNSYVDLIGQFTELRERCQAGDFSSPLVPKGSESGSTISSAAEPVSIVAVQSPTELPSQVSERNAVETVDVPSEVTEESTIERRAATSVQKASEAVEPTESAPSVAEKNIRVDVALLEELMNLVGELVLARNQILQCGMRLEDSAFAGASQRLNLITTELQERVMQTRMQPIGTVWSKLPRVIRDLALTCGKQVRVEMFGKETELDRTILEAIKDPLTHIVRNAVDHGIEPPAERAERNKPRTGTLTMRAYHESGQVNIEIIDDGRGLDLEAIRRKSMERGLVTAERLEKMTEHDLTQLVFLPGFSTAKAVTNVSGRGVGMDVVKTNIERIGGTVDLTSRPGLGTTLRVRIPLTLAIVPALIVVSGGHRFAVPQTNLLELVRLEGKAARAAIESVHGTPIYRLRGQILPLALLNHVLSGTSPLRHGDQRWTTAHPDGEDTLSIVVLHTGSGQLGLVVDEVRDTEEIVVKPLGAELRGIPLFAGATIMGDGRVALILDVAGVAQHVSASSRGRADSSAVANDARIGVVATGGSEFGALLLFNAGQDDVMAVPVSRVTRIEEFQRAQLERAGDSLVIQYRGEILSLIELAPGIARGGEGRITVLVFTEHGRSIGLIVQRILDVVEERVTLERSTSRPGVLGTVVVQGKVADVLDVHGSISRRAPWFYKDAAA